MIQFYIQLDSLNILHLQVDLITNPEGFIDVVSVILLCYYFLRFF